MRWLVIGIRLEKNNKELFMLVNGGIKLEVDIESIGLTLQKKINMKRLI